MDLNDTNSTNNNNNNNIHQENKPKRTRNRLTKKQQYSKEREELIQQLNNIIGIDDKKNYVFCSKIYFCISSYLLMISFLSKSSTGLLLSLIS